MNSHPTPTYHKAYILLAPAFDEQFVVNCLCQVRDNGLAVDLVSLSTGLLSGQRGVTIRPDLSLTQLERLNLRGQLYWLVIPGSSSCVTALLADPRVHRLLKETLAHNGGVAATASAYPLLAGAGLLTTEVNTQVLAQNGQDAAAFIQEIINRMI